MPPKGGETQKRSRCITRRKCGVPSIFAFGKDLDAGRIHSARADKMNRVEPPKGGGTPKRRTGKIKSFLSFFLVRMAGLEPARPIGH